ncbi:type II secretion system F family protein [Vibrio salinus]|uniref:type II secretion system F family protein n=1 Tax=Vibrio salinus TaxID=2899784 RepID=UPI001E4FB551|nr:type II secretion system F family protein [Vibrio salinus]MCE0495910.1 type II secretion system F family protein [Vibrio salinus]
MKLDGLTLIIFAGLFGILVGVRYLIAVYSERKERARYLSQLKQLSLGMVSNPDQPVDDGLMKIMNVTRFHSLPLVGSLIKRLWTDLEILGWQEHIWKRSLFLFIPSFLISLAISKSSKSPFAMSLVLTLTFFFVSVGLIYFRAMGRHLEEFKQNLPQAIDAIVRAARAGVPVTNTFSMVADNLPGPLASEFLLIDNWLKVGVPLKDAMRDSSVRVPLNEYRFFVVILIINQETGGRLSETLARLSDTLRARQELALKIKAKTSEVRASASIVALLAPLSLAYMYFNSPKDFLFLLNDETGNSVLIYAACSVGLGLFITHYMIKRVIR